MLWQNARPCLKVTITRFRRDLFRLADVTLDGEIVEFSYKGVMFRLVPERKASKLARVKRRPVGRRTSIWKRRTGPSSQRWKPWWEKDWAELCPPTATRRWWFGSARAEGRG